MMTATEAAEVDAVVTVAAEVTEAIEKTEAIEAVAEAEVVEVVAVAEEALLAEKAEEGVKTMTKSITAAETRPNNNTPRKRDPQIRRKI